jgi:hypothetical protein
MEEDFDEDDDLGVEGLAALNLLLPSGVVREGGREGQDRDLRGGGHAGRVNAVRGGRSAGGRGRGRQQAPGRGPGVAGR